MCGFSFRTPHATVLQISISCSKLLFFFFLLVLSLCRGDIFFLSLSLLCAFVRTHSGFSCSKWKLDTYWAFVCEQSIKKKKPRQRLKTSRLTYFCSPEDQGRSTQDSHSCEMAKLLVHVKIIILNCLFYLILTTFNDTHARNDSFHMHNLKRLKCKIK